MLKQLKTGRQSSMPEAVATFTNSVCEKQQRYGTSALPPHMVIPLSSGNGRSHAARTVARQYYKAGALEFSSRDIVLEYELKETVQRVVDVDADIQANSEYARDFCGVIAFDLDALMPRLRELPGDKFFEMVAKVRQNATLIIFVPADCAQSSIKCIAEKMGASVKVFPPIMYSDQDFARFFYDFLPSELIPAKSDADFQSVKGRIDNCIAENFRDRAVTVRDIKETAKSIVHNDDLMKKIFGKSDKNKEIGGAVQ